MTSPRGNGPASRLPSLGRRGEGWVAGQLLLVAAVILSALAGRSWTDGYRVAAYTAGAALLAVGVLLLAWAGLHLGASLTPLPAPREDSTLRASGPYALVRHPMYGSGILISLGWSIIFATVIGGALTAVLAVFLDLKARREETWLVERVDGYDAYRERTARKLVPFIY
jgi:protein-S-isoprenylcysteine O-methyltransferase Ste14